MPLENEIALGILGIVLNRSKPLWSIPETKKLVISMISRHEDINIPSTKWSEVSSLVGKSRENWKVQYAVGILKLSHGAEFGPLKSNNPEG